MRIQPVSCSICRTSYKHSLPSSSFTYCCGCDYCYRYRNCQARRDSHLYLVPARSRRFVKAMMRQQERRHNGPCRTLKVSGTYMPGESSQRYMELGDLVWTVSHQDSEGICSNPIVGYRRHGMTSTHQQNHQPGLQDGYALLLVHLTAIFLREFEGRLRVSNSSNNGT